MHDVQLVASTESDLPQIQTWCKSDIDFTHHHIDPRFFLTGQGYLTTKIDDSEGTTLYARFDREDSLLRMHTQFATESIVSRKRVARAISTALPPFIEHVRASGITGILFETTFPGLADFMKKFGFKKLDGENDDYVLMFPPVVLQ
jgi:hypothetical protein